MMNHPKKIEEIIQQFEPKIRKCLLETTPEERDDLRQVLYLKLTEIIQTFNEDNAPTFEEFKNRFRS